MHMVDGAHGHSHGCREHAHEHTHADGSTHSHPHTHEGEHVHAHGEGCQGCKGCGSRPANEQEALLAYMLDHNRHHAAELLEVAKQVKAAGKEDAGIQIEKAVEEFEKGNMRLAVALSLVKDLQ